MKLRPCGDRAVLVEYADLADTMAHFASLQNTAPDGVEDLIPAARTVLVRHCGDADSVAAWIRATGPATDHVVGASEPVTISITYDGEDLEDVADATGLSVDDVVAAHTGQIWTVAFGGFAPGFGYLVGSDDRLHVPRRDTPRTSVPAGSVGLAGEFSGIYPRSSPGGWQLIGHTDAQLFDPRRDPPAVLRPGAAVRFDKTVGFERK